MTFLTPRDLGALVREARIAAGMTQTALGDKVGASRFWVAEFERGKPGAELGLCLKALRALKLVLTVEPAETAIRRGRETSTQEFGPVVDLSSILDRSSIPLRWDPPLGSSQPATRNTIGVSPPRGSGKRKRH